MKSSDEFNHINDIWSAFERCDTVNELEKLIDLIPDEFGNFSYEVINPETVRITNERYDESLDQYDTEEVDFDIHATINF